MMSMRFLVEFSGSFKIKVMSSVNRDSLTSSFPTSTLLFLLLVLLLWLGILRLC
jgi:hypothetical protein